MAKLLRHGKLEKSDADVVNYPSGRLLSTGCIEPKSDSDWVGKVMKVDGRQKELDQGSLTKTS